MKEKDHNVIDGAISENIHTHLMEGFWEFQESRGSQTPNF